METWGNEALLWSTKDTCLFFSDFWVLALNTGRHQQHHCPLRPASLLESIFPFLAFISGCRPEGRSMLQLPESYISVNKDIFLLFFQENLSESQSKNSQKQIHFLCVGTWNFYNLGSSLSAYKTSFLWHILPNHITMWHIVRALCNN